MQLYSIVVAAHVLAASVLVASALLSPVARASIRAAASRDALRERLAFAGGLDRFNPIAAQLVMLTGIALTAAGGWWRQGWLWVAVALTVASSLLAVKVVKPHVMGIVQALAGDGAAIPAGADTLRRAARWDVACEVMAANTATLLLLMTGKPSLVVSLALAVALPAALVAVQQRRRAVRAAAVPAAPAAMRRTGEIALPA